MSGSPTPTWRVGDWDLTADLAKIREQWDPIREHLEDPTLFALRNATVSGWSCGEHAGHLAMVTHWIARGIADNVSQPDRDAEGEWTAVTEPILRTGRVPRGRAKAPPAVDPSGRASEEFLPVLAASERAWEDIGADADVLRSCAARFVHFALGYLTSAEWVRFCAVHTAHHLSVVRDVRAVAEGGAQRARGHE